MSKETSGAAGSTMEIADNTYGALRLLAHTSLTLLLLHLSS